MSILSCIDWTIAIPAIALIIAAPLTYYACCEHERKKEDSKEQKRQQEQQLKVDFQILHSQ